MSPMASRPASTGGRRAQEGGIRVVTSVWLLSRWLGMHMKCTWTWDKRSMDDCCWRLLAARSSGAEIHTTGRPPLGDSSCGEGDAGPTDGPLACAGGRRVGVSVRQPDRKPPGRMPEPRRAPCARRCLDGGDAAARSARCPRSSLRTALCASAPAERDGELTTRLLPPLIPRRPPRSSCPRSRPP